MSTDLVLENDAPPVHAKDRMMPDGAVALIVNLREDECRVYDRDNPDLCRRTRGATVSGPHSEYFIIDTAEQQTVLGVQFKPGGAFPFLAPPASDLHGMHVSLEDLWGSAANDLRDQALEAATPEAKFAAIEAALIRRGRQKLSSHCRGTFRSHPSRS